MNEHQRCIELAAASIDFRLSPDEQQVLRTHLAICDSCGAAVRGIRDDATRLAAASSRPKGEAANALGRPADPEHIGEVDVDHAAVAHHRDPFTGMRGRDLVDPRHDPGPERRRFLAI